MTDKIYSSLEGVSEILLMPLFARARDFLTRNPDAVVVHIGCGLDSCFGKIIRYFPLPAGMI